MPTWDKIMDKQRAGAVQHTCEACAGPFWLPPSKVGQRRSCSPACAAALVGRGPASRARPCETCGQTFTPRPTQLRAGVGRFCSQACNTAAREALNAPEAQARAKAGWRAGFEAGQFNMPSGPDNHAWKGGHAEFIRRRRESGKEAAGLRAYRKANPHKVKEFSQRRHGRKTGRLPRGTAKRIYEAQRGKCAICRTSIRRGYHLDHIMPLAKGGAHEPRNVQLLCATCNVRKNARDPIDYMRSLGRLL